MKTNLILVFTLIFLVAITIPAIAQPSSSSPPLDYYDTGADDADDEILSFVNTSDPVQVSEDQTDLINRFGYPDTFVLMMGKDARVEIWTYYTMQRSFIFLDGEFANDDFVAGLPKTFCFPQFRPTQFTQDMTLAQAKRILGEPSAEGQLILELMKNTTIYDFHDQVRLAVKNEKVLYVQTLPVAVKR